MPLTAQLEVSAEPGEATLEVEQYQEVDGKLEPRTLPGSPRTTPLSLELEEGSYRLRFSAEGYAAVNVPLLLTRGTVEDVHIVLPREGDIPRGYLYVPPGSFLQGISDPEALRRDYFHSPPLHRVHMDDGYLIGEREVTFRDWLEYLRSLPPDHPARRLLEMKRFSDAGAVTLRHHPSGKWQFSFYGSGSTSPLLTALEGERVRYPRRNRRADADWRDFPLSGVSWTELEDYFGWLARSGMPRGARACTEREWERAGRGADGRPFPHGFQASDDDANVDSTYGRDGESYGPDMAGTHPASISPWGLLDMLGNINEMVKDPSPDLDHPVVVRGGSWFYPFAYAHLANRTPHHPGQHHVFIGVRVCAPFKP